MALFPVCVLLLGGTTFAAEMAATGASAPLQANMWVKAAIDWKAALPAGLKDASFNGGDGYSDNVWRSRTGTVIIRTGVDSKSAGYSPGFYSNASVEWDPRTDTAKVIDIANWGK
jgi:hypothetical protein